MNNTLWGGGKKSPVPKYILESGSERRCRGRRGGGGRKKTLDGRTKKYQNEISLKLRTLRKKRVEKKKGEINVKKLCRGDQHREIRGKGKNHQVGLETGYWNRKKKGKVGVCTSNKRVASQLVKVILTVGVIKRIYTCKKRVANKRGGD